MSVRAGPRTSGFLPCPGQEGRLQLLLPSQNWEPWNPSLHPSLVECRIHPFLGWLVMTAMQLALSLMAAGICLYFAPAAQGSGIPVRPAHSSTRFRMQSTSAHAGVSQFQPLMVLRCCFGICRMSQARPHAGCDRIPQRDRRVCGVPVQNSGGQDCGQPGIGGRGAGNWKGGPLRAHRCMLGTAVVPGMAACCWRSAGDKPQPIPLWQILKQSYIYRPDKVTRCTVSEISCAHATCARVTSISCSYLSNILSPCGLPEVSARSLRMLKIQRARSAAFVATCRGAPGHTHPACSGWPGSRTTATDATL